MNLKERKVWIDNLRWIIILVVVIFHIFFYYNNIGIEPMFKRLAANPAIEGERPGFTFGGIFQYSVYQWFMLLLFLVSGICAKYTLKKKTVKEFLKSRTLKLLVPSTIGVITIQWISGYLNMIQMADEQMENIPGVIKYFICLFSGIGALWFCQVLFIGCLVLALIKAIDKKSKLESLGEKSNLLVAVLLYLPMFGAAQILNVPMIPTYRMCYYPLAFLLGYYVFSSEKLLFQLKKYGWICLVAGIVGGIFYIKSFYGIYYAQYDVLNNWISVFHAWFTAIGILGLAQVLLEFKNPFTNYMNKAGWGIYINHIIILQLTNILLKPIVYKLPLFVVYFIELISALVVSIALWELLRRIPVIRYCLYGIKSQRKPKKEIKKDSEEEKITPKDK